MIGKDINQIAEEDLQALVENSVLEGKTIEYKQKLPNNSDSSKKKFLADVSSSANASGGDLIYGITEDRNTGTPKMLEGLDIENADQEISRLDNIVRNGIEPRIPSVTMKSIGLTNSKTAIIIRISKSWISPHRVIFKGHDKFYSRSSNGKYPLDVAELRLAFNFSETIAEKIRKFRENRISNIIANEMPIPLYDGGKIVLHLIPVTSFDPTKHYSINKIDPTNIRMRPIYSSASTYRYNLDGLLFYRVDLEGKSPSYVQLFRNGIVEAVEGSLLRLRSKLFIPGTAYEKELIRSLSEYLDVLKALNIELPIFLFLALVGVRGYSMATDRRSLLEEVHTIDRDVLALPEIMIENYDIIARDILRPCFDSIWNACGFPRSLNYNEAGK